MPLASSMVSVRAYRSLNREIPVLEILFSVAMFMYMAPPIFKWIFYVIYEVYPLYSSEVKWYNICKFF